MSEHNKDVSGEEPLDGDSFASDYKKILQHIKATEEEDRAKRIEQIDKDHRKLRLYAIGGFCLAVVFAFAIAQNEIENRGTDQTAKDPASQQNGHQKDKSNDDFWDDEYVPRPLSPGSPLPF